MVTFVMMYIFLLPHVVLSSSPCSDNLDAELRDLNRILNKNARTIFKFAQKNQLNYKTVYMFKQSLFCGVKEFRFQTKLLPQNPCIVDNILLYVKLDHNKDMKKIFKILIEFK
jgi:hypothetical protein